jgi:hypothetical protein
VDIAAPVVDIAAPVVYTNTHFTVSCTECDIVTSERQMLMDGWLYTVETHRGSSSTPAPLNKKPLSNTQLQLLFINRE